MSPLHSRAPPHLRSGVRRVGGKGLDPPRRSDSVGDGSHARPQWLMNRPGRHPDFLTSGRASKPGAPTPMRMQAVFACGRWMGARLLARSAALRPFDLMVGGATLLGIAFAPIAVASARIATEGGGV